MNQISFCSLCVAPNNYTFRVSTFEYKDTDDYLPTSNISPDAEQH